MKYRLTVYADKPRESVHSPIQFACFDDYTAARDWFNSEFVGFGNYFAWLDVKMGDLTAPYWQPSEEWHS